MIRRQIIILLLFSVPLVCYAQEQSMVYEVHFERNKYELSFSNQQILSLISNTLIGKSNYIIYINGHTDSDADSSYNQQLSKKRSLAVKEFLIKNGIEDSLFRLQAMGEEQPLVANTTPLGKAKNRRVEILVLFQGKPKEEIIGIKNILTIPSNTDDTTVTLEGGYILTLSRDDWAKNSRCLQVNKTLTYKFKVKENWLKKHIGFKNYKKVISYEPHYEFYVVSCNEECFKKQMKLAIPQYKAPGLRVVGVKYSQKKNDINATAPLVFKKSKIGDSAYYVTDIYCPGSINCGTDNRCTHLVSLYAGNRISILSYSYYIRGYSSYFDSLVEADPLNSKKIKDSYTHAFFHTLKILYKGDIITLNNIPIDVFGHGIRKIKSGAAYEKSYVLFIPYRKKYKCGHYKKYKIRARDIENLKQFNLLDLPIRY